MLVSPSRIHYSSLESLEGFFQLFRDIRWWVQWWQYDRKKISFFYFVYKHPYFDSFQPCIWTKSRIFLLLDISIQCFFKHILKVHTYYYHYSYFNIINLTKIALTHHNSEISQFSILKLQCLTTEKNITNTWTLVPSGTNLGFNVHLHVLFY